MRLKSTQRSDTEIAFDAGYETHESFTRAFKARFGKAPRQFRDQEACSPTEAEATFEIVRMPPRRIASLRHVGPSHTPEDLVVFVEKGSVLFAGDLVFRGRIPFVGQADSRQWIASLDRLMVLRPKVILPGHGPASTDDPLADLSLTREYLAHLRRTMGEAARSLEPFEEAYARADWSRYAHLPLFSAANRMNAYNTYLLMEQQPER